MPRYMHPREASIPRYMHPGGYTPLYICLPTSVCRCTHPVHTHGVHIRVCTGAYVHGPVCQMCTSDREVREARVPSEKRRKEAKTGGLLTVLTV